MTNRESQRKLKLKTQQQIANQMINRENTTTNQKTQSQITEHNTNQKGFWEVVCSIKTISVYIVFGLRWMSG